MLINLERLIQRVESAQQMSQDLTFTPGALHVHQKAIAREVIEVIAADANIAAEKGWSMYGFRKALLALLERPEAIREPTRHKGDA